MPFGPIFTTSTELPGPSNSSSALWWAYLYLLRCPILWWHQAPQVHTRASKLRLHVSRGSKLLVTCLTVQIWVAVQGPLVPGNSSNHPQINYISFEGCNMLRSASAGLVMGQTSREMCLKMPRPLRCFETEQWTRTVLWAWNGVLCRTLQHS